MLPQGENEAFGSGSRTLTVPLPLQAESTVHFPDRLNLLTWPRSSKSDRQPRCCQCRRYLRPYWD